MENWKDIKGYEGIYQISKDGFVKSLAANGSGKRNHDIVMNSFCNGNGYRYVTLTKDKKRKNHYIHRLVAQHFIPNPDNKEQVNHKDLNKKNNNYKNLEWSTPLENTRHAIENGRMDYEAIRKITSNQVLQIREKEKIGFTINQLADEYNLSKSQIWRIVKYKNWKSI